MPVNGPAETPPSLASRPAERPPHEIRAGTGRHLTLRTPAPLNIFIGALGVGGALLAAAALVTAVQDGDLRLVEALEFVVLFLVSVLFALHYPTTVVHATDDRLWLDRYGVTWWTIAMQDAGTTEGTGPDWRFIFVFSLESGKRVGKINWYVFDREAMAAFGAFIDQARERLGVELPKSETP